MKPVFIESYGPQPPNDKLKLVVETTAGRYRSGIYSAIRDDISKPIIIDWGDGTTENISEDISRKVHTYSSIAYRTYNVIVENIKSFAVTDGELGANSWYYTSCDN